MVTAVGGMPAVSNQALGCLTAITTLMTNVGQSLNMAQQIGRSYLFVRHASTTVAGYLKASQDLVASLPMAVAIVKVR